MLVEDLQAPCLDLPLEGVPCPVAAGVEVRTSSRKRVGLAVLTVMIFIVSALFPLSVALLLALLTVSLPSARSLRSALLDCSGEVLGVSVGWGCPLGDPAPPVGGWRELA